MLCTSATCESDRDGIKAGDLEYTLTCFLPGSYGDPSCIASGPRRFSFQGMKGMKGMKWSGMNVLRVMVGLVDVTLTRPCTPN